MSRFAGKLAQIVFSPSVMPLGRRTRVAPHSIVLLLTAAAFFYSYPALTPGPAPLSEPSHESITASDKCVVLQRFFESPRLLADFDGTPAEMQRWVDAYDRDCR
jgi:hypothetical protein